MAETKTPEYLGTGRRKTAVARVRLATGSGKIVVNGRPFETYFPVDTLRATASQPLTVTATASKFDARISVSGGGPDGHAGAVGHGIAPALFQFAPNLPPPLKAHGLPTRYPLMGDGNKEGQPGRR